MEFPKLFWYDVISEIMIVNISSHVQVTKIYIIQLAAVNLPQKLRKNKLWKTVALESGIYW